MKKENIFVTGGEVSGDSMIGYEDYFHKLKRTISQKLNATGGLYIYGLYRTGKTSLIKKTATDIVNENQNTICVYTDLNKYNTNSPYMFENFLLGIIHTLKRNMSKIRNCDLRRVSECINYFENDDKISQIFREDFEDIFAEIKDVGLKVLLIIDEFDAAKNVFSSKADFELFRNLTASNSFSVCLVTVSRQELSMIEHSNPNNSSFKGVMYPFLICGFDDGDICEYKETFIRYYDYELSEDTIKALKFYCGSSPYLWSCFGYQIVENLLTEGENKQISIEEVYHNPNTLSKVSGYHDSVFKCLNNDKDFNGNSYIDKLVGIVIGPSFFITNEDIIMLKQMNYLMDNGSEYITVSPAFKKYLMDRSYNSDILNNFDTLERKLKNLISEKKLQIFTDVGTIQICEDDKWYDVLTDVWRKLEGKKFNASTYQRQIHNTDVKFGKKENALDVMSLEDVTRIIRAFWCTFEDKFNNERLDKWEVKLRECGKARNPVHHGSENRLYSAEKKTQINSYCIEIIKQIS